MLSQKRKCLLWTSGRINQLSPGIEARKGVYREKIDELTRQNGGTRIRDNMLRLEQYVWGAEKSQGACSLIPLLENSVS